MQLVLAIHADRRQTERIAALLCKRAAVAVVQASDAGEGLQELGDRVPDLILTSPLLSPFDEDVLAEYLRELGSAAAHVQTLRIPMLTAPEESGSGFFSLRKKRKVEATPDGCDPAIFVEEITQYLVRAAEERKAISSASRSWTAPSEPTTSKAPYRADAFEPHPPASQTDSYSAHHASYSYPATSVADEADRGTSESAFPTYRPDPVTRHDDEPGSSSYRLDDAESVHTAVATDHVHLGHPSDDVTPIYQPPSFLDRLRSEPVEPLYQQATASTPIYQPPPIADAPLYPLPAEPVVHVFEPPPQPAATAMPAETPDPTMEPSAHAQASLVLDPPQPEAVAADPPFVVHSTEARIPLAESLERAAAELEASSLGEPMPARETERVPLHDISSIEEIPLPEELAARVEHTAALRRSIAIEPPMAPPPSALSEDPLARDHERSVTTGSPSLLASPIEIDIPPQPVPAAAPVSRTATGPAAADVAPERAFSQHAAEPAVEPEKGSSQKRTASFEAALAAIRKAWGRPRRAANANLSSPLSLNLNRPIEEATASPEPPESTPVAMAPPMEAAADPVKPYGLEDSSAREVDLTLDIEALDDHGSVTVVEPTLSEQVEVITQPVEEDVYELSASPALHDLEADLAAAAPPPPVREMFPSSIIAPAEEPAPIHEEADAPEASPHKRDKHRKNDKRKPLKAQKPVSTAVAPPATPSRPPEPPEPAQDEWGLFDPNRCGFAALVDKLNEVTDDKDQKPAKTTVRVISYG